MMERKAIANENFKSLSKRGRARLLGVNLSSLYIKRKGIGRDLNGMGLCVNHKKVYRLMGIMGLEAIYPKKNLSKCRQSDAIYPYLLREYPPLKPHDVWCVDITYIRLKDGFVYLTALIDVVSRHVMGFNVSTSLDTESCLRALEMAIKRGYCPKIINSDQGCQFTSQEWIYNLALLGVKISMDGKGRCLDNIPIERFWRTLKYEEVYLKTYDSVFEAKEALSVYIYWYNHERRHSGINHHRPFEVMTGLKEALTRSFKKADGYGDNLKEVTPIPQPQQQKLSSKLRLKTR